MNFLLEPFQTSDFPSLHDQISPNPSNWSDRVMPAAVMYIHEVLLVNYICDKYRICMRSKK